ncbi:inositol monophosphatase family protein [Microbacterium sp. bgisy207]|uniref:inositol monophosphatase family protein n=1 Tax=Microbacterium sp. bgisy207 TaxID=3413800 RepID=UPI003EC138BC
MTDTDPGYLESIATSLAREAGQLALVRRSEGVSIAATKSAIADIVTDADREVETLIRARLREIRPADGFLGEESDADPGTSGITWVVDPIDGTVNYAYGIPSYAVSIAAVQGPLNPGEWTALAGAVYVPPLDEMFHAARGGGAWLGERRLRVETDASAAGALLATGFGYDPTTHAGDLTRVARVMPMARDIRRMGAASIDLCSVAAGRLDGYFERGLKPWDHAAAGLIVTESGGRFGVFPPDETGRVLVIAAVPGIYERLSGLAQP